jgi:hypothetical protein
LGQAQQADPLLAASGLGKIVAGIQTPTTVTQQTDLSTLNLIGSLLAGTGGSIAGVNKILEGLNIKGGIAGLPNLIGGWFGGTKQAPKDPKTGKPYEPAPYTGVKQSDGAVKYPLDGGGYLMMMKDGTQYIEDKNGKTTFYDKNGLPWDPTGSDVIPRDSGLSTGGADLSDFEKEWDYLYQGSVKPEDSLTEYESIVDPRDYASNGGGNEYQFAFDDRAYDEGYNTKDNYNWGLA